MQDVRHRVGRGSSCGLVVWGNILAVLTVVMAGCTPAYVVRPVSDAKYAPSTAVQIIGPTERPNRPFVTIAEFQGTEQHSCPAQESYCDRTAAARRAGADAVWIQHTDSYDYPGEWKMIKGRLSHIHGFTSTVSKGIFVRYVR